MKSVKSKQFPSSPLLQVGATFDRTTSPEFVKSMRSVTTPSAVNSPQFPPSPLPPVGATSNPATLLQFVNPVERAKRPTSYHAILSAFVKSTNVMIASARRMKLIVFLSALLLVVLTPNSASAGTIISAPKYLGLNQGLVGYWTFDGADTHSNGKTDDKSGKGNTGTLTNGPTKVQGTIGQALSFDGVNDRVNMGNVLNMGLSNWTTSAWIKTSVGNDGQVVSKKNFVGGGNPDAWSMDVRTSGKVNCILFKSNRSVFQNPDDGTSIKDGQWHHVVCVWNRTGYMGRYIDGGTEDGTSVNISGESPFSLSSTDAFIVGDRSIADLPFTGLIDDVRIYNRALSATEIKRLYLIGLGSKQNRSTSADGGDALSKGLVGYWTFDGLDMGYAGTRAKDVSGRGNHGTLTGTNGLPTQVQGKIGQALRFDGVDDYVDLGNEAALNPTTAMTISAWINLGSGFNIGHIISTDNGGGIQYKLQTQNSGGKIFFSVDATGADNIFGNTVLVANRWYHIVGTYDGSNLNVYVNGVVDATPVAESGAINANGVSKWIGNRPQGGAPFTGLIDDVRIYNRALSAAEIQRLYNQTQSKFNSSKTAPLNSLSKGLVGYWTFDGQDMGYSGTRAKDVSGNQDHGTLTGANGLPTRIQGKIGQGLSFDGVDDYVNIGDKDIFSFTNGSTDTPFSISAWLKKTNGPNFVIVNKFGTGSSDVEWTFYLVNSILRFEMYEAADNSHIGRQYATALPDGQWFHVVGTYDGTEQSAGAMIYLNGVRVDNGNNQAGTYNGMTNVLQAVEIGASVQQLTYSKGVIDDVRIYNRALSAGEVNTLYQMGR